MKVKELIAELQKLDPEKNIWQMYDPPFYCGEVEIEHLVGEVNSYYVDLFEEVEEGDYAIICG